jgi:hypothetical protein
MHLRVESEFACREYCRAVPTAITEQPARRETVPLHGGMQRHLLPPSWRMVNGVVVLLATTICDVMVRATMLVVPRFTDSV